MGDPLLRFNPIFASIIDAKKIILVEIIAEINKVMNDKLESNPIGKVSDFKILDRLVEKYKGYLKWQRKL